MLAVSSAAQVGILNIHGVPVSLKKPGPAILACCHQEEVCASITCHIYGRLSQVLGHLGLQPCNRETVHKAQIQFSV